MSKPSALDAEAPADSADEITSTLRERCHQIATWLREQEDAWATPFPNDWDAAHLHVRQGCQSAYRAAARYVEGLAS